MNENGWAKLHRKELRWFDVMSDRQFRFYNSVRLIAIWDKKNSLFGTFDARIKELKKDVLRDWATGKICEVRKELMDMGALQKTSDHRRLRITNAEILMGRGREAEDMIQFSEDNLLIIDKKVHPPEKIEVNEITRTAVRTRQRRI